MATIPSGKNKTRGVMLNDHVGKILGEVDQTQVVAD